MLWRECPTLDLDLGVKLGARYESADQKLVAAAMELLRAIMAQIPPSLRPLAEAADARTGGRFSAEANALAFRHNADWREVMLANISYDLLVATTSCSTIALPSRNGPVVARNMDWFPERLLAQASCLLRCCDHGDLKYTHAGWAASIGVVTGLSARGFGLALNAVSSSEGGDLAGYPVLLFLRTVLEDATDFDHALKAITSQRLACSGLITLVGEENEQRVVVERNQLGDRRPLGTQLRPQLLKLRRLGTRRGRLSLRRFSRVARDLGA